MSQLPPLPVALPLIMAALLALLEKIPRKHRLLDLLSMATAGCVLALDLKLLELSFARTVVYWFGGWRPNGGFPLGIAFAIDPAGAGFAALAALLTLLGFFFSWHYFKAIETYYHTLMLLFLASMQGFCLSGDLFNMFVFFELMGVSAYALTGYKIEDTGPLEGALNFAVMNSIGAFMVLLGLGMLYSRTGGLNLAWIGARITEQGADLTLQVALMLLCIGFLVKAAVLPFHFWLPDAHAVAPTPASLLFSGAMVELGLYAVARVYWGAFHGSLEHGPLGGLLLWLGLATALAGAVLAFLQRHLKRLLAYSTVSHSGMMLAGIALFDPQALAGTFIYVLGHGMVKGGLFVGAGIILYRFNSIDEEKLRGRGKPLKVVGLLFCLGGLALAGAPPFGTWVGKAIVEERAAQLGCRWLAPIFLAASALTGAAVLRAGLGIFYGAGSPNFLSACAPSTGDREMRETEQGPPRTPVMMWLPFCLLFAGAVVTGCWPALDSGALEAAGWLCSGAGYRDAVLAGHGIRAAVPPSIPVGWQGGLEAGAGAATLALLALFGLPLPGRLQHPAKKIILPVFQGLRSLHSGYVGDYVTWFMVGAAALLLTAWLNSGL